jgi:hypothetical protein
MKLMATERLSEVVTQIIITPPVLVLPPVVALFWLLRINNIWLTLAILVASFPLGRYLQKLHDRLTRDDHAGGRSLAWFRSAFILLFAAEVVAFLLVSHDVGATIVAGVVGLAALGFVGSIIPRRPA